LPSACSEYHYDLRQLREITAKKGILLIEDAASAMGSRIDGQMVGTMGDVGVVSFQDTKPLSAKTGGLILTNDDQLAQKLSAILRDVETQKRVWNLYFSSLFRKFATQHWVYPLSHAAYKLIFGENPYEIVTAPEKPEAEYFRKC
jgi:dTDP-4-amino-4,6-dideoxygalactose transaminase